MLKVLDAGGAAGRRDLARLFRARSAPDFAGLRDALPIVEEVLRDGIPALLRFVKKLEGFSLSERELLVDPREAAAPGVDPGFARAFRLAVRRIGAYHARQRLKGWNGSDGDGVTFTEFPVPHDTVGVYVPGGRAFYPSSLMMGVVPARVAGVKTVIVATPVRAWRESPELRWAASELGVDRVLLAGGAHGIAGLAGALGCTKVIGPGNRWVAAAKHLVSALSSTDLPAGPSEVLILASAGADPVRIAADLLAQAEHDPDAICLLFTTVRTLAVQVGRELREQIRTLPTRDTARRSLETHGRAFVFSTLQHAVEAGCFAAVEHVQLMGREAERHARRLAACSGAVFLGNDTPTAFGDYLAGPNHVLPTGGAARSFAGLSTRDFYRWGRTVHFSRAAARTLAAPAALLARFEGLEGHARSLDRRSAP